MDWKEAYHKFNPMEPLEPGDGRLYKDLFGNFLEDTSTLLSLEKDKNQKFLFSGNCGCGKSTFLNYLETLPDMKKNFFIVKYTIRDILDIDDITHIDLILSLTLQAFTELGKTNAKEIAKAKPLLKGAQELALSLAGLLTKEDERELKKKLGIGAEVGAGIPRLLAWIQAGFFARYQIEKETREIVREHYKPRMTDFLRTINDILGNIQRILKEKYLLILIDGTDRIPSETAMEIFFDNGQYLSMPNSNILFVVDTSISCSSNYSIIVNKIGKERFFPAVKIKEKDGTSSNTTRQNHKMLRKLVFKRMPEDFIEKDALEKVIDMSGGVVRELIRIIQHALFFARGKVSEDDVEKAIIEIRNEYNLSAPYVRILESFRENSDWLQTTEENITGLEPLIRKLLYMPALFQYRNGEDKWYKPYPIFIPWLKQLKH